MSMQNRISAAIPDNVLQDAISRVGSLDSALKPYLTALTADDRQSLFKLGEKSVSYLSKVKAFIASSPQFVPGFMEVAEFEKGVELVAALDQIYYDLKKLLDNISDTRMLAGSEAMMAATLYYASVREAAGKNVADARTIYEELRQRFPYTSKKAGRAANG